MAFRSWMNTAIPVLVDKLGKSIREGYHISTQNCFGATGRYEIYAILDDLLAILFPGSFHKNRVTMDDIDFFLDDTLRKVSVNGIKFLKMVFSRMDDTSEKGAEKQAREVLTCLIEALPVIREELLQDIDVALKGDPAASCIDEIILSYPFVDAVATHRIAHNLYCNKVPLLPRIMSERAHSRTGIDIHPGARISPGFFIDHGTGVVIGETCTIGRNVKLYQGVTLGALSPFDREGKPRKGQKRHPDIEDDVIIYANATILGGETVIGRGSIIGGNTWITSSVPPASVVYTNLRSMTK